MPKADKLASASLRFMGISSEPESLAQIPRLVLLSRQRQLCANTSLIEAIAEFPYERREAGLAGAVARRDALQVQRIVQHPGDTLDLLARRQDEMESANGCVELPVDLRCGVENLLDAGMRASNHDRQALRGSDGERHFVHLPCARFVGPGGQHEKTGNDFRGPGHDPEVASPPGSAAAHFVGILTVEVAHVPRHRVYQLDPSRIHGPGGSIHRYSPGLTRAATRRWLQYFGVRCLIDDLVAS